LAARTALLAPTAPFDLASGNGRKEGITRRCV
jgi:hypothetical protein